MQNRYVIYPAKDAGTNHIPKAIIMYQWQNATNMTTLLSQHFRDVSEFIVLEQAQETNAAEGCHAALPQDEIASAKQAGTLMLRHGQLYFTMHAKCSESLAVDIEQSGVEIFSLLESDNSKESASSRTDLLISRIPDGVLRMIFANLLPEQIVIAARTNKQFNRMTNQNNQTAQLLWKMKYKLHFPNYYYIGAELLSVTNWVKGFKMAYIKEYDGVLKKLRPLFSIAKEGDLEALKQFHQTRKVGFFASVWREGGLTGKGIILSDLTVSDKFNRTAMRYASIRSHQLILDYLYHSIIVPFYAKGVHLDHSDYAQNSIIHWAVRCNQPIDYINKLIDENKHFFSLELANVHGYTILILAVMYGHLDLASALLAKGANLNAMSRDLSNALMFASTIGHLPLVSMILDKDIDINAADDQGGTALMFAVNNGHATVVKELLIRGAEVNQQYKSGETALHFAAASGYLSIVRLLLANKANMYLTNNSEENPLHVATQKGYTAIVNEFIATKPTLNLTTKDGSTELILAAESGNIGTVKALLEHKASILATRHNGETALFVAAKNGHLQVARILLKHAANVNTASHDGVTALYAAKREGHHNVVKILQIKLLEQFIEARNNDPLEFKTIIGFFGSKKKSAYTKAEEITAAKNMIQFLKGEIENISDQDKKILNQGDTELIVKPVKRM
jgi:ankyrin repeat protein